jgi:hypothetical protein
MLDNLYSNIGSKIKNWAKWVFIVEAIASVIGAICMMASAEDSWMLVVGMIVLVVGPFIAWVSSWLLYGFCEIIVKLTAIEHNTRSTNADKEESSVHTNEENEQQVHILTDEENVRNQKIARVAELRKKGLITEEMYQEAINNPKILDKF